MGEKQDSSYRLTADGRVYRKGVINYANKDRYEGEILDGMRHGRGSLNMANDDMYEGEFENNVFHGFGTYIYSPYEDDNGEMVVGKRYEGFYKDGLRHGKGVLILGDGDVYSGEFEKGLYHGQGSLRLKNGDSYVGEFARGKGDGKMVIKYSNGNIYEGGMMSGQYHLKGKLTYANGFGFYDGEYVRGYRHGKGTRLFMNGTKYVGMFRDGEPEGEGIMYYSNGDQYIGNWMAGRMDGIGIMKYVTGDRYEGTFKKGFIYGEGKYVYSDGGYYQGEFRNTQKNKKGKIIPLVDGKRHGFGLRVWSNGSQYKGQFVSDQCGGNGELVTVAGGKYEGDFFNGLKHGIGSENFGNLLNIPFTCPVGHKHPGIGFCRYTGSWVRGGMEGKGIFTCMDGRTYNGEFKNSKRHGFGTQMYLQEGEDGDADAYYFGGRGSLYKIREYVGQWEDGIRNGSGKITYVTYDTIEGNFKGGQPHGVVLYTYAISKKKRSALYEHGNRIEWLEAGRLEQKKIISFLKNKVKSDSYDLVSR